MPVEKIERINNTNEKYELFGKELAKIARLDPDRMEENLRKYAPTAAKILLGRIPISEVEKMLSYNE